MQEKRKKWINIIWITALILVIAFAIITTIVVNYQSKQLEDLGNKNDQIPKQETTYLIEKL